MDPLAELKQHYEAARAPFIKLRRRLTAMQSLFGDYRAYEYEDEIDTEAIQPYKISYETQPWQRVELNWWPRDFD